jgi:AbiV family abortive infection protein
MTVDEIDAALAKIHENAAELLDEAKILHAHGKFARAYLVAHIAAEELARIPMTVSVGTQLVVGRGPDWKKFYRRTRSHLYKLRMLFSMGIPRPTSDDRDEHFQHWQAVERLAQVHMKMKDHSFYVEKFDGTFQKPSEVVAEAEASLMIQSAEEWAREFASTAGKKLRDIGEPEVSTLREMMSANYAEQDRIMSKLREAEEKRKQVSP